MEDLLLIGLMAAAFVFGYFIMDRLGKFLDRNRQWLSEANSGKKGRDVI